MAHIHGKKFVEEDDSWSDDDESNSKPAMNRNDSRTQKDDTLESMSAVRNKFIKAQENKKIIPTIDRTTSQLDCQTTGGVDDIEQNKTELHGSARPVIAPKVNLSDIRKKFSNDRRGTLLKSSYNSSKNNIKGQKAPKQIVIPSGEAKIYENKPFESNKNLAMTQEDFKTMKLQPNFTKKSSVAETAKMFQNENKHETSKIKSSDATKNTIKMPTWAKQTSTNNATQSLNPNNLDFNQQTTRNFEQEQPQQPSYTSSDFAKTDKYETDNIDNNETNDNTNNIDNTNYNEQTTFEQNASNETSEELTSDLSARAIYDYQAEEEDELSFDPGELITNVIQFDEGWWRGECRGKLGVFPANYVQLIDVSAI